VVETNQSWGGGQRPPLR